MDDILLSDIIFQVLRYAVVLILCWSPASPLSLQAAGKSTGSGLLNNEPNTDQLIANKLFKTRPSSSVDRSPNVVDTGLETETSGEIFVGRVYILLDQLGIK